MKANPKTGALTLKSGSSLSSRLTRTPNPPSGAGSTRGRQANQSIPGLPCTLFFIILFRLAEVDLQLKV